MPNNFSPVANYDLQWDNEKPFYNLQNGGKQYLSPMMAVGLKNSAERDGTPLDPRITNFLGSGGPGDAPGGGYLHSRGHWNPDKGKWDQDINYGNILSTGLAGAMAAPALMGLAGGGGGAAAGSGAAATAGSTTIPTVGLAGGVAGGAGTIAPSAAFGTTLASTAVPGAGLIGATPGLGASGTLGTTMSTMDKIKQAYDLYNKGKDTYDAVGKGMGDASNSMAKNRGTMAELMLDQNKDLEQQLMAREQEKRAAQSGAYRNAMVGSHAMNYQPSARPAGVPGSYQSTALSPQSRDTGGLLYREAMQRMLAPDMVNQTGMPTYRNMAEDPQFQDQLKAGKLEKGLGMGSWISPLAGALLNRGK